MKTVYSFDVFDTCLIRECGDPDNVFSVVANEVVRIMGKNFEADYLRDKFVVARKRHGNHNSLIEIYEQVSQDFPLPVEASQMAHMEMEIERKMLRPVAAMRDLVAQKRKRGRIIFISDMYLPSEFIRSVLAEHGFFREGDALYVSGEMGARKYDGSLFRMVRKKEGITTLFWHHYGDDKRGDFLVPRLMGIRAHLVKNRFLRYEEDWRNHPSLHYPYSSMLAGLGRAIRLGTDASRDHAAFVCDIVAPMMVTWVAMVMNDAVALSVRKLFFCARDTYPEYHIAKLIKENDPRHHYDDIEIHYLFTSQRSLYQGDKSITLRYLEQNGVASHASDVAIVDSRSSGNSLKAINDILTHAGYTMALGYLMCLSLQREAEKDLANYPIKALFSNEYTLMQSLELGYMGAMTEQIFSLSDHYRTVGYVCREKKWRPVLEKDSEITTVGLHVKRRQQDKMLEEYAMGYIHCGLLDHTERLYHVVFEPTMIQFATLPRRVYLKYLTKVNIAGKTLPFVQNCFKSRKSKGGRWLQGSLVYTFPRPIVAVFFKIQRHAKVNKFFDKLFKKLRLRNPTGF